MAGDVTVKLSGIDEAIALLRGIPDKLRKRALRNALAIGARLVRDAARQAAPVISPSDRSVRAGIRKPGTVRDALSVRTSKIARRAGDVGVFVNVRPAPGAKFSKGVLRRASQRGKRNPNDPFYWRWLQFGWTPASSTRHGAGLVGKRFRRKLSRSGASPAIPGRKFLEAGAKMLGAALEAFKTQIGAQLARLNINPKDPL